MWIVTEKTSFFACEVTNLAYTHCASPEAHMYIQTF